MSEEKFLTIINDLKNGAISDSTTSVDLLHAVRMFSRDKYCKQYFIQDYKLISSYCCKCFYLEDYFTLRYLKEVPELKDKINEVFKRTVNTMLGNKTLIFLNKIYQKIKSEEIEVEDIYDYIIEVLKEETDNKKISAILFDLCLFYGFREKLYEDYPILATMIVAYSLYKPDAIGKDIFAGSSIIGCLLKNNNEDVVRPYVEKLLGDSELNSFNMQMIGGGGSSLVYKINDLVLKLGETRNSRRIFINHRIMQSLTRDLISKNDQDLMWIEIMHYAITGDVTEAERNELKADLLRQGIIWDDDKIVNCGVLQEWDTNDRYYYGEDPNMLATIIDNPVDREEFNKRSRRVVVIDSDNFRPDFTRLRK